MSSSSSNNNNESASTNTDETTKNAILRSSDGEIFEVDVKVAMESITIKNIIEEDLETTIIPIPNVTGRVLSKVIEFCKEHVKARAEVDADVSEKNIKEFDKEFVNADYSQLLNYALAANYLHIEELLELTCQAIADKIKDKTVEEVRDIFGIKNDFEPHEEEALRRENQWVFE
ncbi:PREDICTED: SKP1-like protein 1A [Nelumbo nucifera]|uniref:SKP1-like protein n=2 Tax=Nelumbo nucifera TaxID=4432 RepID=A0A822ZAN6_NELNU|nr:PREDICTED: SKP1-like protein 1A [Nelumbo nucifera]DAD40691.1 TPA_asm: hypothetical protein HUJ06_015014 [Nelumbo nucifera]